jgi:small-conductance mechanosensitive channel
MLYEISIADPTIRLDEYYIYTWKLLTLMTCYFLLIIITAWSCVIRRQKTETKEMQINWRRVSLDDTFDSLSNKFNMYLEYQGRKDKQCKNNIKIMNNISVATLSLELLNVKYVGVAICFVLMFFVMGHR